MRGIPREPGTKARLPVNKSSTAKHPPEWPTQNHLAQRVALPLPRRAGSAGFPQAQHTVELDNILPRDLQRIGWNMADSPRGELFALSGRRNTSWARYRQDQFQNRRGIDERRVATE